MNAVLATLGTRLTERFTTTLTIPGLLYIAMWLWSAHAGHTHAFDPEHVSNALDARIGSANVTALEWTVRAALLLVAAAIAGVIAALTGRSVVGRLWVAERAPEWWLERRRSAWRRNYRDRDPQPPTRYEPARLTPIGDSFRLVGERADAQYGLSVPLAWPRLMILADVDTRAMVNDAYDRYRNDATLAAWGLLTLPLAVWWWPAVILAVLAFTSGYWRSKSSAATLASLIESVIDVYQNQLAATVGVRLTAGCLTRAEGPQINNILNKRG